MRFKESRVQAILINKLELQSVPGTETLPREQIYSKYRDEPRPPIHSDTRFYLGKHAQRETKSLFLLRHKRSRTVRVL